MVQRILPSKLGIQADNVKSDKRFANLKPSSSQNQDCKSGGIYKMNKMKSKSIQVSDLEPLQSLPSVRSLSQPRKASPLHVPTTAASPQRQKSLVRRSPNYMKPTSSSDAKRELWPVSLRNAQSGSDGKNLPQKCLSNSNASSVSSSDPAKTLSRSSSLNSVRTLTKTPSFKPCKACLRKSTSALLLEDMDAPDRATCSSTLKDSKFPAYLMLHPGGTESEGASVMKVCPYTYCSLNDHGHVSLPSLKSFMSERRHLLETRKNMKSEAVNPQRWKEPYDTKIDSDIEQVVFDGKPACDEADMGNPIITPLAQEIGMDFFIEIYAEEKEAADVMGRINSVDDLEDKEDINFTNEENGIAAEENVIKQVTPGVTHDPQKSQINIKEDFENYFDAAAAIEAESKWSFHLEQSAEDADENHPPSWFHEETCAGSYCNEVSYDGEHQENTKMDESDSQHNDMDWEEEQFRAFNHGEDTHSSICSMEETDSKLESLSEGSHDISEMWVDGSHCVDILVDEPLQEAKQEKGFCSEVQPLCTNSVQEDTSESIELETQEIHYPSNSVSYEYDQSTLTEEVFQYTMEAEDNNRENDKHVHYEASCVSKVLDEETVENSGGHKISDTSKIDESQDSKASRENNDEGINQENLIHFSDVPQESTIIVQDQKLLEENQVKASKFQSTSCTVGEEQHTRINWQWSTKRKRSVEDDEKMRKINPGKPNFLPLVPDPEPVKVDLKHQMIDERKNADEWMLDFALRQAVTRLAPAGKRKVALLVEAFETVMSNPKCETNMRNNSPFAHARPIQACS
ncbi:hypothetical protein VNO77_36087 [Canavalia gladiata]|uniref:Calmodulin-binding domain-containing protein n=1 Tax=Canavalia gladiata TaxID=3824 RepID=A0AAN9K9P1_CANGL